MKVYTIKYVLSTHRIELVEVEPSPSDEKYVYSKTMSSGIGIQFVMGRTAFEIEADAVAAAEKMRARKVASIDKQRAKLLAAKFEVRTA